MLFGIIQIGLTFTNYLLLTNAAIAGAQTLSISRGITTPYTTTTTVITGSVPTLTTLTTANITTKVNGTACSTDAACATALTSASGDIALVTATYPCNLTIVGINFAPSCTLTAQAGQVIQ
jgi:hypothetical protein